jgi:anti-anti-sigma factor
LKPAGDINIKNIGSFYRDLEEEFAGSGDVVIDLSAVKRIDLAAAQVIIAAGRKGKELKRQIKLKGVSPDLKKLFAISGIKV